jgi:hypothetical protein
LIETRRASNILDIRSYRGANYDSGHYLVRIKYRGRITTRINKNNTCRHKDKLQTNRLKDPAVKKELQQKVEEILQSPGEEKLGKGCIEEEWLELKNSLWKTSKEVLGFETKVSESEWFDADCEKAIGKKNDAYKYWLGRPARTRRTHYEQLGREANKI